MVDIDSLLLTAEEPEADPVIMTSQKPGFADYFSRPTVAELRRIATYPCFWCATRPPDTDTNQKRAPRTSEPATLLNSDVAYFAANPFRLSILASASAAAATIASNTSVPPSTFALNQS